MESTLSFGYWIRRQRKALDLTQQALADKVGCSLASIKKIEGDERKPSLQIAERMADVLGVPGDQREAFLKAARGVQPVDQLSFAREPTVPKSEEISVMPSGTVTFLFTDIEGSTRLAQQFRETWEVVRKRHHAILREAIEAHHGHIFQIVGDGFCASFHTPTDSLKAATDAQRILQAENLGKSPIKVRMGIHTGEVELQDNEYHGYLTLSLVQRLLSAGHGGQILVSQATEYLLHDQLAGELSLLDLGEYKLKDVSYPLHLFQVITPELQEEFPPLRALDVFPNNLPMQLTSFIGRDREVSEVRQLLENTRLLTLTGPGGTGKTRLALQLATEMLEAIDFVNGVWFVELAPLTDPTLVAQTIAATIGVREQPRRTILEALTDFVRAKNMLLILDNCEHLIEICAQMANDLLHAAPRLKILATSRESLGIAGETVYRVPSFPLPSIQQIRDLDTLKQNDCVHLFMDRALAVYPSFRLKEKNALAITDICRRLDGIPLAIELAAARTNLFPPQEIATRLDDRFKLLTGGSRTALERHQTLFALIEWSHNLLSEPERVLLRRLSVFAGGWSFAAAQEICGDALDDQVLELLTHLVDKSLVAVEEKIEEARYRLPETIRQYARDKLYESGEAKKIRDHHLAFFLRFAETAEPKLRSAEQIEWLDRLEIEYDNLRTALGWSLESGQSDLALQLASSLYYFWVLRGNFSEGYKWISDALVLSEREQSEKVGVGKYRATRGETARRAKALYAAGWLQMGSLNVKNAKALVEESASLSRDVGNKWWTAVALELMGLLHSLTDPLASLKFLEEGISLARQIDDPWPLAVCLIRMGDALKPIGKVAEARPFLEQGVALARTIGDRSVLSEGLRELASLYYLQGDFATAERLTEESLAEARLIRSFVQVFLAFFQMVIISCLENDPAKAKEYCFELWVLARDTGSPFATVFVILTFGWAASVGDEPGKGVRLLATTDALMRGSGLIPQEGDPTSMLIKQALEKARAKLGPEAFQTAWTEGRQLTVEKALALATQDEGENSQSTKA